MNEHDDNPVFSVIMAAFNAESTIAASIESVILQTCRDWELVVVDDGSNDRTGRVVESYEDSRITLIRQSNAGTAAARNAGLSVARGSFVSLLDSDDLYLPTYLEMMGSALDANQQSSLAYTDAWILDQGSGRVRRRTTAEIFQPGPSTPPDDAKALFRELIRDNFVFGLTMVRRGAYRDVGGFAETLGTSEDYEMWLRLAWQGHRFVRVPGPLVIYRRHPGSKSAKPTIQANTMSRTYRFIRDTYDLDAAHRQLILERLARADRDAAVRGGKAGLTSVSYAVRTRLRAIARRVLWRRVMFAEPPASILETLRLPRNQDRV